MQMGLSTQRDVWISHPKIQGRISHEGFLSAIWHRLRWNLLASGKNDHPSIPLCRRGTCEKNLSPWRPRGGNLLGTVERLCCSRPRASSLSNQEESLWHQVGTKVVVQEVGRLDPVVRLLKVRWGLLPPLIRRWHAILWLEFRRAGQSHSATTIEVHNERSTS